jgi:hypothetical protein
MSAADTSPPTFVRLVQYFETLLTRNTIFRLSIAVSNFFQSSNYDDILGSPLDHELSLSTGLTSSSRGRFLVDEVKAIVGSQVFEEVIESWSIGPYESIVRGLGVPRSTLREECPQCERHRFFNYFCYFCGYEYDITAAVQGIFLASPELHLFCKGSRKRLSFGFNESFKERCDNACFRGKFNVSMLTIHSYYLLKDSNF